MDKRTDYMEEAMKFQLYQVCTRFRAYPFKKLQAIEELAGVAIISEYPVLPYLPLCLSKVLESDIHLPQGSLIQLEQAYYNACAIALLEDQGRVDFGGVGNLSKDFLEKLLTYQPLGVILESQRAVHAVLYNKLTILEEAY